MSKFFPKLTYACPLPWTSMTGDERERFCHKCSRSVINLSMLTEDERTALLASSRPEELCVAYYRRLSGDFVTPENSLREKESRTIKQLGVAALSAGALALAAGCTAENVSEKANSTAAVGEKTTAPVEEEEAVFFIGMVFCEADKAAADLNNSQPTPMKRDDSP